MLLITVFKHLEDRHMTTLEICLAIVWVVFQVIRHGSLGNLYMHQIVHIQTQLVVVLDCMHHGDCKQVVSPLLVQVS